MKGSSTEYGKLARILHWSTAILVFILLPLGFYMKRYAADDAKPVLYRLHIVIGVSIGVILVLRLIWMLVDVRPNYPEKLEGFRLFLFRAVHISLLLTLVLLVFSGITTLLTTDILSILDRDAGNEIRSELNSAFAAKNHSLFFFISVVLLIVHLTGVISYHKNEEKIMWRMGMGKQST